MDDINGWNQSIINKLKNIQKTILARQMMLNLVINSNNYYNKIYMYFHMGLASIIPIMTIIETRIQCNSVGASTPSIIISFIVAAMVKVKSMLPHARKCDIAKEQHMRYKKLYEQIDTELIASIDKRQNGNDFLQWIVRTISDIELSDPVLNRYEEKNYNRICSEKNILNIRHVEDKDRDEFQLSVRNHETKKEMDRVMERWQRIQL